MKGNDAQHKKRVLVAMSGGADSSVSAALLLEQGYHVEGAFIITWTAPWLPCTWKEERDDAQKVAEKLNIPFHTVDLSHEYERDVVDYFVAEYKVGRTPNPDVMCNKYIKFGGLYSWARERDFDFLATGHYAQVDCEEAGVCTLKAGVDRNKDQSYFLWTLTSEQLSHVLFPVGHLEKRDVRALAKEYDIPVAEKKDSQGVCFLGKIDMHDFLLHYFPNKEGQVLSTDGRVLGVHDGAAFYTLGQRHGFRVHATTPDATRLYVVAKDMTNNTITVAPEPYAQGVSNDQYILVSDCNWIRGKPPLPSEDIQARLRYRQQLFDVSLDCLENGGAVGQVPCARVHPHLPQAFVPEGQSIVFYSHNTCLGGGIILGTE